MGAIMTLAERVSRRLKMGELRMLLAVAQWGSMSKAAADLNISQSAISKGLGALEDTHGFRLLDRTPHGVEPTIYGEVLLRGGVAVFDEVRQRLEEIEFLSDPTAGELRVGTTSVQLTAAVIQRCLRRYPRMVFHITEPGSFSQLYRDLRARTIDLALGRIPETALAEPDIDSHFLSDEPTSVMAGAQNPWTKRRKIELADLMDEHWVTTPPDSYAGALHQEIFRIKGLDPPRVRIVTLSIQLVVTLLANGSFLALLPASILRFASKGLPLKALPVHLPPQPRSLAILTLKNRTLSPGAGIFIEAAHSIVQLAANRQ